MRYFPIFTFLFSGYWFVFWMMNGLDKFFYGESLGFIDWHGKDRHEQMNRYFGNIGVENVDVDAVLNFAGVVEVLAALPFVVVAVLILFGGNDLFAKACQFMKAGLIGGFCVFLGFIIFDIIAGDRLELLEHSTYLVVVAVSLAVCEFEAFMKSGIINVAQPQTMRIGGRDMPLAAARGRAA